ncbi:MAG: FKBP-type peptidyl-prolyl cis-trans isomerase [Lachnospiraceae bacterium]|nr:FKBP-type peptidyl-prolyl cis-trans isomerase [Lachnospiraceae bacterium]
MEGNTENTVSRSKQKREDRAKNQAKKKREGLILKIVGIVIAVAVVGLAVFGIVRFIINEANTITPNGDYSAQYDDNGYIKGVRALDYVTLCDYKNIEVPESEVTYTDEEFQNVIKQNLEAHQILSEEGVIKDGDKVKIDYVGTIDGVEFEGGNSGGNGYDLTIGSGSFIEGFESQLIGHKPGEDVTVDVKFPDDYHDANVAGKPAQFAVTIHGIYVDPAYDDDFVCAYYPEMGSTVAEYEQSLKDEYREGQLHDYVDNYIKDNSTVIKFPNKYFKQLEATTKYADVQSYEYMKQMYSQYGMEAGSFDDFVGKTGKEYDADIIDRSQKFAKADLVYQAILESEGIALTAEESEAIVREMYDDDEQTFNNFIDQYGKGYTMKQAVQRKAVDIALEGATVK